MKRKQDNVIQRVVLFFDNDYEKALTWFATEVPALGNVRPLMMMGDDKIDRLTDWLITETDA